MHANNEGYLHKNIDSISESIKDFVEWASDNYMGSRSSIQEKDRKKYLEFVFSSLTNQEIKIIIGILAHSSKEYIHSQFLPALINHGKGMYGPAIEGFIISYALNKYPISNTAHALLKQICQKKEKLNPTDIAMCNEFFNYIEPKAWKTN